jgi:hypothetical protein
MRTMRPALVGALLVGMSLTGMSYALSWQARSSQSQDSVVMPQRFNAFAVSLGGPRSTTGTAQLDIVINRWSTDAERKRLVEALKQSQDELLETLRDLKPVGYIRSATSIGYDLHYAHQVPGDEGGRRIFIATDRPMGFWEVARHARTVDYPFTLIELRMNREGEGEGKLSVATRVIASSDGKYVELENYTAQPVQLNQVRRVNSSN